MLIEARLREIVEQLQQIVVCGFVCFLPGCPELSMRHALLDFVPSTSIVCVPAQAERLFLDTVCCDEHIQALCDLALLSGRVSILNACHLRLEHWCISSLALVPVERPTGMLGLLLFADEQPEKFGPGEERLLCTGVAQYAQLLECMRMEQAERFLQEYRTHVVTNPELETVPHAFIKNEIVSMVGHELRAPLSVIKGYAGLLQMYGDMSPAQEQSMAPERQIRYIDAIMEQTHFLEVLVNDLLDLSRLQHGKLTLRRTSVDVGALCWQIIQFGQLRANQQELGKYQFVCNLDAELLPVWADADRLRQVLLNLMENALKYSPQGGRIELAARCVGPCDGLDSPTQVYITLRDQGMGIPQHQMAHVFQAFERLERPTTAHIPGFGLGLYIARYLVEAMGGTLDIQSCEGSGTDVTIRLSPVETRVQVPSLLA
jgi:signal transduction histidine kinase